MTTNVLMNPPYSQKWDMKMDERFEEFGLAPKSKADFAFLLHGFNKMSADGKMAIVLPGGVLFRNQAEGKIRKKLLEKGVISAVIELPKNLFFGADIPVNILVLEKNRKSRDIFFICAKDEYRKGKAQNFLDEVHINKIYNTYINKTEIEKFSRIVSFDEIKENDFNLNISRYIDSFEEEEQIDLLELTKKINSIENKIDEAEKILIGMLKELNDDDGSVAEMIKFFER